MATDSKIQKWPVGADEARRLDDVRSLTMLDTPEEEPFDGIVEVAASLFDVPLVALALMDSERQWFKAKHGTKLRGTSREYAFCKHAILGKKSTVMEDLTKDPRFCEHPFVVGPPHVRFYAGALLLSERGYCVGTLCVLDVKPRSFESAQLRLLERLARQAMDALEMRRLVQALTVRKLAA